MRKAEPGSQLRFRYPAVAAPPLGPLEPQALIRLWDTGCRWTGVGVGRVGEEVKKEEENESSAKQVKVRGRDRNPHPHAERETKKKKLGKKSMK